MRTDHMSVDNSGEITAKGKALLSSLPFLVLLLALLFFAAHSARSAAGDLDPRFGNGGVVQTDYHAGRGGAVYEPVSRARQAQAVKFLVDNAFQTPTELLACLDVEPIVNPREHA